MPSLPPLTIIRSSSTQHLRNVFESFYPNHSDINHAIDDIQTFNALLSKDARWSAGRVWEDGVVAGFWVNRIVQRLLRLRLPVDINDVGSILREVFRVGSLLYISEIRRQFGVYPVVTRVYTQKLKDIVEHYDSGLLGFEPLKVWALVLAATEAEVGPQKAWFIEKLVIMLKGFRLTLYQDLRELVEGMFWLPEVHDVLLSALWYDIEPHLSRVTTIEIEE